MSIVESGVAQITAALAKVPTEKKTVWLTTVDTHGVVRSGIVSRIDEHWSFGAEGVWALQEKKGYGFAYVKVEF